MYVTCARARALGLYLTFKYSPTIYSC